MNDDIYEFEYGPGGLKPDAYVTIDYLIEQARKEEISLAELARRIKAGLLAIWDGTACPCGEDNTLHAINLLEAHRMFACGGKLPEMFGGES
jgi:hypothetical protein